MHTMKKQRHYFFVVFFAELLKGVETAQMCSPHTNAANFTAGRPRSEQRREGQVTRSKVELQKAMTEAGGGALNWPLCILSY